jgi:DNA polymerase (family 10)
LDRVRAEIPEGLAEIARLAGAGPRLALTVWRELGVTGLAELREAAAAGRLRDVPRLGAKREAALLDLLSAPADETRGGRAPLGRALPVAEELARDLAGVAGTYRVEVAGSARRGTDTVGDLDLVAATDDPEQLSDALAAHPVTQAVLARGPSTTSVMTHSGLRVELRTGPPAAFGNLLQHATGSAAHNLRLRELAARAGLSVSEHGITDPGGGRRLFEDEDDVYAALGLAPIPPELREDAGEIEAARAGTLPRLVSRADLVGDLHVHTDWSDGKDTLETMVEAARARGYRYVAISDHSGSLAFAGGLDPDRVKRQWEAIDRLGARLDDIQVLKATEMDILADGALDFPDDLLEGFDWVTASVHSAFRQGRDRLTERLLAAIEHPLVDVVGHPTGRMFGRRESYEIDLDLILQRAAATGTFLEINAQPHRMDLNDRMAAQALAAGVRLTIGSDAHSGGGLDLIAYGVLTARRAGATAEDIVTTRPWPEVRALRPRCAA